MIDVNESFPTLAEAPIVEAIFDVRARAEGGWNRSHLRKQLESKLPEYPEFELRGEIEFQIASRADGSSEQIRREAWRGVQVTSADRLHVAQFNRDGFVFSRLSPYSNWDQFRDEALRLWRIHAELAKPSEIHRFDVRFINRIALPIGESWLSNLLLRPPAPPKSLEVPIVNFFHQDTFSVPGYPYAVNRIQTIQFPSAKDDKESSLILDIDVATTQAFEPVENSFETRLVEMRWLKNKVFFGSVTAAVIQRLEGTSP